MYNNTKAIKEDYMLHFAVDFSELKKDFKKKVVVGDTHVMVVLLADQVYAIQDKCTHMGASLSKGTLDDKVVKCRVHGAKYDITSGEVIEKAHLGFVKMPTKKAKTFKTVIKDDKVYIEIA